MTLLSITPRSWGFLSTAAVAVIELVMPLPHRPTLIWNASASAPIGLYYVTREPITRGSLVVAIPPNQVAQFADKRHYLPRGVPLIKFVAGMAGDTICSLGNSIAIDGQVVAKRLNRDSLGRPLPKWRGCRHLDGRSVFLLNPNVPTSFDGRYFGPMPRASILGTARPLWTR